MIAGIVITIIVFLIVGFFIVILVTYMNQRKKKHIEEKHKMQLDFQQGILKSQLEIQEQTFNYISQEIHDNVGQILSLAKVQINIMTEGDEMSKEMLIDVKNNIGKAMNDLRDIAKSLSSERIKNLTIHSAVFNEAERISKSGIIRIGVHVEGEQKEMDQQKKLILFRIVQESIQNIIKHADASEIVVNFHYGEKMLQTIIKDNGKGFDLQNSFVQNTGLGLSNIKSRAIIAGGNSVIESAPNAGTTITVKMPYE
jgi:two-component system, NarL family, sensor kinase